MHKRFCQPLYKHSVHPVSLIVNDRVNRRPLVRADVNINYIYLHSTDIFPNGLDRIVPNVCAQFRW